MCPPSPPKVQQIPERQAARLPDNGDPAVREAARQKRRLATSAMIFTNQSTLGAPSVSGNGSLGGG